MPNKKIYQFPILTNPTGSELFPLSVGVPPNYAISLSGLTSYILSGFTDNVLHWVDNANKILKSNETIVISGNYVLSGTNLTLETDNLNISIGNINFNKYAQIFIGGHLLLINSNIINNGLLSVAGGIILSGNSTITGTGIIE